MTAQISNNPKLLKLLEWDSIAALISKNSHFIDTVKNRILTVSNEADARDSIYHTREFLDNYYNDTYQAIRTGLYTLDKDESFFSHTDKLNKEGVCDLSELNEMAKLIEFHFINYKNLKDINFHFEDDFNINKTKGLLKKPFIDDLRSFYDTDGSFNYLNHPKLSSIYKQILEKESLIRKFIGEALNTYSQQVQFSSYDVINDRYVIPVKTDAYSSSIGQIISRSDSGNTLYVEPSNLKTHNYKRLELILSLEKEINSLTINYSKTLSQNISYINKVIELVFYLDTYFTRSSFAHINNYVLPDISDSLCIDVKDAFHPLIKDCITNSFKVLDQRGLIISGPNTGGKTATLKTLTLITLFSKFGLACPCSKAKVSYYNEVYYFGNDQQDLAQGLSSFAGEVKSYNEMLCSLSQKSLIVIDEIFNSTSSEEASALAVALFEQIHKRSKAHILVSTHHQMLKSLIHADDDYISAHVGFDPKSGKPTYKINFGSPGGSQALSIFEQLSSKDETSRSILKKASKLLDKKMVSYESLLEKISKKENELHELEKENRKINIELKNQKASMEGILNLKLQDKLQNADSKIKKIIDKAESVLNDIKKGNISSKKSFINHEASIKSELNKLKTPKKNLVDNTYKDMKPPKVFIEGDKYFSISLKQTVTLVSFNEKRDTAKVAKGALSISCPLSSLRVTNVTKNSEVQFNNSFLADESAKIEYDCRGMRLEEFKSLVESISGQIICEAIPFVNIIHGHGTGVLKKWLRDFIKNNKNLSIIDDTTGNDGETRFELKS